MNASLNPSLDPSLKPSLNPLVYWNPFQFLFLIDHHRTWPWQWKSPPIRETAENVKKMLHNSFQMVFFFFKKITGVPIAPQFSGVLFVERVDSNEQRRPLPNRKREATIVCSLFLVGKVHRGVPTGNVFTKDTKVSRKIKIKVHQMKSSGLKKSRIVKKNKVPYKKGKMLCTVIDMFDYWVHRFPELSGDKDTGKIKKMRLLSTTTGKSILGLLNDR